MTKDGNSARAYKEMLAVVESCHTLEEVRGYVRNAAGRYTPQALRGACEYFAEFLQPRNPGPFHALSLKLMLEEGSFERAAFAAGMLSEA